MITAMTVQITRIDNMDVNIVYEDGAHLIHSIRTSSIQGKSLFVAPLPR
jgi:hypothetical protein